MNGRLQATFQVNHPEFKVEGDVETIITFARRLAQEIDLPRQDGRTAPEPAESQPVQRSLPRKRKAVSKSVPDADDIVQALREIGRPASSPEVYEKMIELGTYQRQPMNRTQRLRDVMRADPRIAKTSDAPFGGKWYLKEWGQPGDEAADTPPVDTAPL